jgi:hypothetical protein
VRVIKSNHIVSRQEQAKRKTPKEKRKEIAVPNPKQSVTQQRHAMRETRRDRIPHRKENDENGHLPSGMPAIHAQVTSGHEAARITEQEDRSAAVLLRARQAAEHVLLGPLVTALRELDEQLLDHGGDDVAGRDGVDADVVLAPLGGEVAAQLDDGGLAGVVGGTNETLLNFRISGRNFIFKKYAKG